MSLNNSNNKEQEEPEVERDPIWTSSRTARLIYGLGTVEEVSRLTIPM